MSRAEEIAHPEPVVSDPRDSLADGGHLEESAGLLEARRDHEMKPKVRSKPGLRVSADELHNAQTALHQINGQVRGSGHIIRDATQERRTVVDVCSNHRSIAIARTGHPSPLTTLNGKATNSICG